MSSGEQDTGQERTEEPTPRRLQKAKEKGQVPRSKDLNTMAVLLVGASGLLFMGTPLFQRLLTNTAAAFEIKREMIFDTNAMIDVLFSSMIQAVIAILPICGLLFVVTLLSPMALGGWSFSMQALKPKPEKLNPIKGIQRLFGAQGLMEFFKTLLKFLVVGSGAAVLLSTFAEDLMSLPYMTLEESLSRVADLLMWGFLGLSSLLVIIAVVDAPFQIWQHTKQLRMTRQEIKDEMKETEGKPEVKMKIRQIQQENSRKRMIDAVPEADVVITNPTHFAVALKYDQEMGAPRVVAKGQDNIARIIREKAEEHKVPILRAPPLARALFYSTKLDQQIPAGLYVAVAQILAFVYQMNAAQEGLQPRPDFPSDIPVPKEFLEKDKQFLRE